MKRMKVAEALLGIALTCGPAYAVPVYLTGANLYAANPGTGAATDLNYQLSTNSEPNGGHGFLPIDLVGDATGSISNGISFEMSVGDNVFHYRDGVNYSSYIFQQAGYGLNLFFNDTGVSFNPARGAPGIAGDLTVAIPYASAAFLIPSAGTQVQSYTSKNSIPKSQVYGTASGSAIINVGNYNVMVAAFNEIGGPQTPQGSFTINVSPVSNIPEPATVVLMILGLAGIELGRRRSA